MDRINAVVTNVVDAETIEIQVTYLDPFNAEEYGPIERVRIERQGGAEIGSADEPIVKSFLETEVLHKLVRLEISSRDKAGQLIATYTTLS